MMHLIVNERAGGGRAKRVAAEVAERLPRLGIAVRLVRSAGAAEANDAALSLPRGATVVAIGGDGTIHALLGAALARDLRVGVVPGGSGDDAAHALGLRRFDTRAAAQVLAAGREVRVDVGVVNGVAFLNAFGSGFDADVARRARSAPGWVRGIGRYLWGVAGAFASFEEPVMDLTVDDHRVHADERTLLVSVQNGPRGGGSFQFAPGASIADGRLDVVAARSLGRSGTLALLPRLIAGRHLPHPRVTRSSALRVEVRWSRPVAAHADGEPLQSSDRYRVSLLPGALRMIAP
jgi:diacylglycerol kinase (ATP)